MVEDLQVSVVKELQRRKGGWREIADAVEGVSYSFIEKLGGGRYPGSPSYRRLRALFEYFAANPLPPQSASHTSSHTAADTVAGTTTA